MTQNELFESIAIRICNKKESISADECFKIQNSRRAICREKCRISEKSFSQLNYVKSSINKNIFLKACPGSGKTEVVALKTSYELINWNNIGGIAVLSFTQNSANVIADRVREFIGVSKICYPHYIGTIDSWIHSYIAHPFSYRVTEYKGEQNNKSIKLIDSSSDSGFLNSYSTKYPFAKTGKILAHQYYWDAKAECIIFSSNNRVVDQARKKQFEENEQWKRSSLTTELCGLKERFWSDGFATYQDIEYISYLLISEHEDLRNSISKRFPFIIIDECQDLSWIQLELLRLLKNSGTTLHFVGDTNQAIYEFKDVDPMTVLKFITNNQFITSNLETNYRSNQEIVNISQKMVSGTDITGVESTKFKTSCICINYNKNINELASWFESELGNKSISISKSAVVARGWSTVRKLRPTGHDNKFNIQQKIASSLYFWSCGNRDAKKDALSYIGEFISKRFFPKNNTSKRHYYCPDNITSPLKWRLFLARVLEECGEPHWNLIDLSITWTVWAKNIKNMIHLILENNKAILDEKDIKPFTQCNFVALRGNASNPVINTINTDLVEKNSPLRITTIHSVKGETLDAIMVVSAPDKRGATKDGHWSYWLEDSKSEKARLAYVASSRPKHLLIWAVPDISEVEKLQLSSLGFSIINLPD